MSTDSVRELYEYAATLVSYSSETGEFEWLPRKVLGHGDKVFNGRFAGKMAGTETPDGYIKLGVEYKGDTKNIKAHRLAWLKFYGELPENDIDHINQIRSDNRIKNLRDVPRSLNQKNQKKRKDNTSGYSGVFKNSRGKNWVARVRVDGKTFELGSFEIPAEAAKVVFDFRIKNGFTELHGAA